MTQIQKIITEKFADLQPMHDFVLAPLTYMKIGGPAEVFLELKTRASIVDVVQFCTSQKIPMTVFGGASNVIIDDAGLKGVVLCIANDEYEISAEDAHVVRAGAGMKTAIFVRKTIDDGLQGLEYFLGVPGKLGGAIYNNAHYMSNLIGEYVTRVEVIQENGKIVWLEKEACHFAYDYSLFHENRDILLSVEFRLTDGEKNLSLQLIKEATEYRAQTQPLGEPSSGCYFRNSPNTPELQKLLPQFAEKKEVPSSYLIDHAGLKGTKVGGVSVSKKHAAFFVNDGKGSSEDVKELAEVVKQRVFAEYGVQLREEVFFLKEKSYAKL
jgi:UDP-N-acetylmuramate dehydrogenase